MALKVTADGRIDRSKFADCVLIYPFDDHTVAEASSETRNTTPDAIEKADYEVGADGFFLEDEVLPFAGEVRIMLGDNVFKGLKEADFLL